MKIKLFAAAAAVALSGFAGQAQAAGGTWTVTVTGKLDSGYDTTGVFGTAGQDLTGLTFSQSITTTSDPEKWLNSRSGPYFQEADTTFSNFSETVIINGHSATFNAFTFDGIQRISNEITSAGTFMGPADSILSRQLGTSNGSWLSSSIEIHSFTPVVPTHDFQASIPEVDVRTLNDIYHYAYFNLSGAQEATFAATSYSSIYNFAVTASVTAVPEPETYAMLLAGLGLVGAIARRKRIAA